MKDVVAPFRLKGMEIRLQPRELAGVFRVGFSSFNWERCRVLRPERYKRSVLGIALAFGRVLRPAPAVNEAGHGG